jgi:predicted aconitase with swiveling domain
MDQMEMVTMNTAPIIITVRQMETITVREIIIAQITATPVMEQMDNRMEQMDNPRIRMEL